MVAHVPPDNVAVLSDGVISLAREVAELRAEFATENEHRRRWNLWTRGAVYTALVAAAAALGVAIAGVIVNFNRVSDIQQSRRDAQVGYCRSVDATDAVRGAVDQVQAQIEAVLSFASAERDPAFAALIGEQQAQVAERLIAAEEALVNARVPSCTKGP